MPIKFPRMHIANSVVNRILNIADGIEESAPSVSVAPPVVPDTVEAQSTVLDAALATPTPALPPIDQAPDAGATLGGKPLLATVLEPDT